METLVKSIEGAKLLASTQTQESGQWALGARADENARIDFNSSPVNKSAALKFRTAKNTKKGKLAFSFRNFRQYNMIQLHKPIRMAVGLFLVLLQ